MKRRQLLQAIAAAVPLAAPLAAQQQVNPNTPASQTPPGPNTPRQPMSGAEVPKLETSVADAVSEMTPRFFNAQQFAALKKLSETLMPPMNGAPGALEARAPEFLDFLIGESPADRQQTYRAGLDELNAQANRRFQKPFAEVNASQAKDLLAPLRAPWTFDPPTDPLARFLRAAKQDVRTATVNSREYVSANVSGGGRRGFGGQGQYWYPLD